MNQNMNRLRVVDAGAGFGTRTPNVLPPGPVEAKGKFLYVGSEKLYVRGVTYGTFRPNAAGEPLPEPGVVDRDFFEMASSGVNAVRLYTVPPHWLLDLAQEHGLRVMAGLPWEQHVAFLEERKVARRIEDSVRAGVRSVREHPALLCFSIGNEIPAPIVRWHGRRRVEQFLSRLHRAVSTEFLELPFLDLVCFNVYLESRQGLSDYLLRLHNLGGERPLLMAEIGLDSRRNEDAVQAESLAWQLQSTFESGCAGAFLFSWTDEWHRRGHDIEDWDFGLTTRDRRPLEALAKLDYPDYEVIVVDDGSTDDTAQIAHGYDVQLISTRNEGLSSARNTGWQAASGEIVAYIDDDAYPDPHWLTYLALTFLESDHCGAGGPNIAPHGDGTLAECVASAPGGPAHVLFSDRVAEHVPGCNMAFRRSWLERIGGFDPQFRTAGDDVDVCWRMQEAGGTIGFHPAAVVWHHRRSTIARYWKQQVGYGRAEALLARKWPDRFNTSGHVSWGGRIYGRGLTLPVFGLSRRIYQGTWGSAPFQSLYEGAGNRHWSMLLMPEWYLVVLGLATLVALGLVWRPLLLAAPLLALAVIAPIAQALRSAARARFARREPSFPVRLGRAGCTAFLHLIQPAARLYGRLRNGLDPWRRRGLRGWTWPREESRAIWSERWVPASRWLESLESILQADAAPAERGGHFDRWDLRLRWGPVGGARLLTTIEEHDADRQYVRFRIRPRLHRGRLAAALSVSLALFAALDGAWLAAGLFAAVTLGIGAAAVCECGTAVGRLMSALDALACASAESPSACGNEDGDPASICDHTAPVRSRTAT
jgi:GT2 family glycosyltransferase